ncbi:NADH-quinone oxidoreductase subunit NuoF [Pigmentibacter sp. JX0631]|uniref:NADH-quinone oxidoreductase subunit NuoF n=1 Tax=Pigmentibacter sp. JX0631 TaxID=2976982 RepID=UPI002468E4B9|nr:NADH-quinone oxidoreductase subunit NuoF [Pigmentibacter sp. JX0631]WGL60555.1 NADH-quinone oxidoreductase subunit NuoF [Pigmentibacter sp. JX0631]
MPVITNEYQGRKPDEYRILLGLEGHPDARSIKTYKEKANGYKALEKVLKGGMTSEDVINTVKASGLRGRGGAGFPTGLKWSFVPKGAGEKYLITNFDEGEPGTYKDCYIAEVTPHSLVEGKIIASYAIGAHKSYIYVRGEFYNEIKWCEQAIREAYDAGYLGENIMGSGFTHHMDVYSGAGAYICGEETGLISSLEGKKGQPKLKPPFPAVKGYLGKPTVVNNVESLAVVPWIINNGADAYKKFGTEKSPGTKLFNVSGPIARPGCYEIPLGYPLMRFLNEDCGGLIQGKKLKAVIPGGSSAPVLTAKECESVTLDYESIAAAGSMLGSGAIIVIPEDVRMPDVLENLMDFYSHESCGQCTPCREGTGWLYKMSKHILKGNASRADFQRINTVANNMRGKTICVLSDAAADPARAIIAKFAHEFEPYLKG